ncbi:Hypothetical predicted protein [Marmota monax]|uniref:Uncharacterized protein n=1 Tax=Marmota monax TaxID=9995 RepID=A0A5E4CQE6_MARMO|nr:hypothetical protein GHT09_002323 [Marmota monax]VTJ84118.1 Hypothetical predicted protein [Marmota monax]
MGCGPRAAGDQRADGRQGGRPRRAERGTPGGAPPTRLLINRRKRALAAGGDGGGRRAAGACMLAAWLPGLGLPQGRARGAPGWPYREREGRPRDGKGRAGLQVTTRAENAGSRMSQRPETARAHALVQPSRGQLNLNDERRLKPRTSVFAR